MTYRVPIMVLLLLSTYCSSQQPIPDNPQPQPKSNWHELPAYHPHHLAWIKDHPTRTKWLLIGIGAGAGLGIGWVQRKHSECPSSYDGHIYEGTPPCPH